MPNIRVCHNITTSQYSPSLSMTELSIRQQRDMALTHHCLITSRCNMRLRKLFLTS